MTPRRLLHHLAPLISALALGCYEDHGLTPDAAIDASGDGAVQACTVDGWPAKELRDARPELVGCECPVGAGRYAVGILEPAAAAAGGTIGLCAPHPSTDSFGALCRFGLVTYVDPDAAAEAAGFVFPIGCMSPDLCLYVESLMPEELRNRCLYADFTPAETGHLPPLSASECESARARGLCGAGCECLADEAGCWGLSERHPTGIRTRRLEQCYAAAGSGCRREEDTCVMAIDRPEWFERSMHALPLGDDGSTRIGYCAPRTACESLVGEYPGVWDCIDFP